MLCPRCRTENREGRRFCAECGGSLALACAACGFLNEAGEKFCGGCGTPLGAVPATATPKFTSPDAYTPKHLAEKILTSKAALEGERKHVTVLFADLKGSMELLADRDPEEARKILDPVLERMMEAVHRYEGTVNQVMGDGIMALFGAPLAHEDHAVRACYAALRMQERVKHYASEARLARGTKVQIRVGLNSGEVVVRAIGSDLRMDYTAIGETTHLAARMEQLALSGTIRLTSATLRLAEGLVEAKSLGALPVKGLDIAVEAHELIGLGPARSRLEAAAGRGLTRFVGRHAEIEVAGQALGSARSGRGQVVAVSGEPGVGKSRFIWEILHAAGAIPWRVLQTGATSYAQATPFLPFIDLLKRLFAIEPEDDSRVIQGKMASGSRSLDLSRVPSSLSALASLLEVPLDDVEWERLDPPQRRERTLDTLTQLLLRESRRQPLLLVVEDLHWIDGETQAVLDKLIDGMPTVALLLLVTYRPEYRHPWSSRTHYREICLGPLLASGAKELLAALLGDDPELQPLKRRLIERTDGNPFFLEETVRMLIETGAVTGREGQYRPARAGAGVDLAPSVQAVLAARIDRLHPDEKAVLQVASVIGQNFPLALLHSVAAIAPEDGRRLLAGLHAAEFVYPSPILAEPGYTFKHALTHEVAYGGLLRDRRALLHGRTADAIETLHAERLAEHTEDLADHAFRAQQWAKAALYLDRAVAKAAERAAHQETIAHFQRGLEAFGHLPTTPETMGRLIDLRCHVHNSFLTLAQHQRRADSLQQAYDLAIALGDQRRLGLVNMYRGFSALMYTGDVPQAIEACQTALDIARALPDVNLEVGANFVLGQTSHYVGEYRKAAAYHGRNVSLLTGDLAERRFGLHGFPAVLCRAWWAWNLAMLGEFAESTAAEAVRIAEALDHPFTTIAAWHGMAFLHLVRGDVAAATQILEANLGRCRSRDAASWLLHTALQLGTAYARSGRGAEAVSLLEEGLRASTEFRAARFLLQIALAEALLDAGWPGEALRAVGHGLEGTRDFGGRGTEAEALKVLGDIRARTGDREGGAAAYRHALALAERLGMRPLIAHCHLGLVKLCRRTDKRELARDHLTTAATMYREMDMRFYLAQAEAAMSDPSSG